MKMPKINFSWKCILRKKKLMISVREQVCVICCKKYEGKLLKIGSDIIQYLLIS
jgi:hypothetical protein